MRKLFFALLLPLFLVACKNKETKIFEFIQDFNKEGESIADTLIRNTKGFYKGKSEVNLDYVFNVNGDSVEVSALEAKISDNLNGLFTKYPDARETLAQDVNVLIRIYDKFGNKVSESPLTDYKEVK